MSEIEELWYKRYLLIREVHEKIKEIVFNIAKIIKEKYLTDIYSIINKYNADFILGIECLDALDYVPVLYLFLDDNVNINNFADEEKSNIYNKYPWLSEARVKIVISHKKSKDAIKSKVTIV